MIRCSFLGEQTSAHGALAFARSARALHNVNAAYHQWLTIIFLLPAQFLLYLAKLMKRGMQSTKRARAAVQRSLRTHDPPLSRAGLDGTRYLEITERRS